MSNNDDLFADRTPRFRGPAKPGGAADLDRDSAYALGNADFDSSPFDFDDPEPEPPVQPTTAPAEAPSSEEAAQPAPEAPAGRAPSSAGPSAERQQPHRGEPAADGPPARHAAPEQTPGRPPVEPVHRTGSLVDPVDEPDDWDADSAWDDGADEWSEPIPPSPNATRQFDEPDEVPPPRPARRVAPTITVGVDLDSVVDADADQPAPRRGRDVVAPPRAETDRSARQAPAVPTPERRTITERIKALFPAKKESTSTDMLRLVRSNLIGSVNVVFVNTKGGVGKTMACAMTGKTFATERTDYVLAVDASPEGGQLAQRDRRENHGTVRSLVDNLDVVERYSHVRQYTSRGESGLEILGSNPDLVGQKTLQAEEYTAMMRELREHYSIILTDCAQGITGDLMGAVLDQADVVVMVSEGADGMQGATRTANEMAADEGYWEGRYAHLVDDMVVLITSASARTNVDVRKVEEFFNTMARQVIRLDYDQALEGGRGVELGEVSSQTRKSFMQLAAAIADSEAFKEAGR